MAALGKTRETTIKNRYSSNVQKVSFLNKKNTTQIVLICFLKDSTEETSKGFSQKELHKHQNATETNYKPS